MNTDEIIKHLELEMAKCRTAKELNEFWEKEIGPIIDSIRLLIGARALTIAANSNGWTHFRFDIGNRSYDLPEIEELAEENDAYSEFLDIREFTIEDVNRLLDVWNEHDYYRPKIFAWNSSSDYC